MLILNVTKWEVKIKMVKHSKIFLQLNLMYFLEVSKCLYGKHRFCISLVRTQCDKMSSSLIGCLGRH